MLVELGLVEQRYQAVLEVLNEGASVTDVARRYGVARQTVHDWLGKYAADGLRGLADRSSRPLWCPHQMAPGGRGADRGDAPGASRVGATHDPVLARA
jgi:transposase-like protein